MIKLMFWNSRGLRNKISELHDYINKEKLLVVGVNETFLTDSVTLPPLKDFEYIRIDKSNHSGGLLLIIHKSIVFNVIDLPQTDLFECLALKIKTNNNRSFLLVLVYCQGSQQLINSNFQHELSLLCSHSEQFVLMGDFNARHTSWNCLRSNKAGKILKNFIDSSPFYLCHPDEPTYNPISSLMAPSTIDLIVTDGSLNIDQLEVINQFTSDHYPIRFNILNDPSTRSPKTLNNYKLANWDLFRSTISQSVSHTVNSLNNVEVIDNSHIDHLITSLTGAALHAQEVAIPKYTNSKADFIVTPLLRNLITSRNRYRTSYNRTKNPADKFLFNYFKCRVNREIANIKNMKFYKIVLDTNKNNANIYSLIKSKSHIIIPPLIAQNNPTRKISSNEGKAEELAKCFLTNHNNGLANSAINHTRITNRQVSRFLNNNQNASGPTVTSTDIIEVIKNSKSGKASGLDNINIRLIKNFPSIAIQLMAIIYSFCNKNCYFPTAWKISKTIALPKPGKNKSLAESYRPISLLSSFSKIYEKITLQHINNFTYSNQIIPSNQFGFRKGHSTSHAMKLLANNIKSSLGTGKTVAIALLDVRRAFDRVWQEGLIAKLINISLDPWLIKLIWQFLKDRQFEVHVGDKHSLRYQIPYGVPQGSVLSPCLYNLYIHDIPPVTAGCSISLYADDTAIVASGRFIKSIVASLKKSIKITEKFYRKWKIELNNEKTSISFHSRRKSKQIPPNSIRIGMLDLPIARQNKYLGFTLDNTLNLKTHIDNSITKAQNRGRQLYTFLKRNSFASKKLKIKIYKTYIRPILVYGAPIINSAAMSNKKNLDICQNKFLRTALEKRKWTRVTELRQKAKIESVIEFISRLENNFKGRCENSENPLINELY